MIKTSDIMGLLESMYPVRDEVIPCFIGEPGIGKTQRVHEFAKKHGVKVVTFILSHTLPSEVSGIRMPDLEHDELRVLDDAKMASLEDGDILFFDEILEAPQQLWSAVLTLLQDRVLASGKKLPNVMIIAASNKSATPKQIPPSTRDRFVWIDLKFDYEAWREWFEDRFGVMPPDNLRAELFKENGYNILTPRKFTKLYEWCAANDWGDVPRQVVQNEFGMMVYDKLLVTKNNRSDKRQLIDAINEMGMAPELPVDWEMLSLEELCQALMACPYWDKIAAELMKIGKEDEYARTR